METEAHQRLKRLAVRFLLRAGCQAAAMEVRAPRSRYRIDAAGYLDARPSQTTSSANGAALDPLAVDTLWDPDPQKRHEQGYERCEPRTAMIECKQSRSDFLRDGREIDRLLNKREKLEARRAELEEHYIKEREPHLREDEGYLFGEMQNWDFASSESRAYRRVLRELRRLEVMLHGETKFWLAARYRLADRLYLLAPAGMVKRRELPSGWGLIECAPGLLSRRRIDEEALTQELRLVIVAPERPCGEIQRQRLLRNIAVAATREATRPNTPLHDR